MKNLYLSRLIKEHRPKFSNVDNLVIEYLLSLDESEIASKSILEIAEEAGVSQTTVYNFVKKLGFDGFKTFKIQIASNLNNQFLTPQMTAYSDISAQDSVRVIAEKVINFNQTSLSSLISTLDIKALDNAVNLIERSDNLHFLGQGGSSVVALDSYQKFMRTTLRCSYISDYHMQLVHLTKLNKRDVCILFSHSGETKETIRQAELLKSNGIPIISLTGNPNSSLVALSDVSIVVYTEESKFRTESLTSRILYLTIMDIIYTKIMFKHQEEYTKNIKQIRSTLGRL